MTDGNPCGNHGSWCETYQAPRALAMIDYDRDSRWNGNRQALSTT